MRKMLAGMIVGSLAAAGSGLSAPASAQQADVQYSASQDVRRAVQQAQTATAQRNFPSASAYLSQASAAVEAEEQANRVEVRFAEHDQDWLVQVRGQRCGLPCSLSLTPGAQRVRFDGRESISAIMAIPDRTSTIRLSRGEGLMAGSRRKDRQKVCQHENPMDDSFSSSPRITSPPSPPWPCIS